MARIRTIKPEFFKHERLFDAECETGLPLRLAFAGLWTQCDREGRFEWRPRQPKVDILPYDDIDFSRVLDALATRGFIVKYASFGREFGHVPSWHRHQVVNNRERGSQIPEPVDFITISDAPSTREARVDHAGKEEGKGKEGNKEDLSETSSDACSPKSKKSISYTDDFEGFWKSYPVTANMSKKEAFEEWKKLGQDDRQRCHLALPGYKAFLKSQPTHPTIHACRFISKRRFDGFATQATPAAVDWEKRLSYARKALRWSASEWGPPPGAAGCLVPTDLLQPGDGQGWGEYGAAA